MAPNPWGGIAEGGSAGVEAESARRLRLAGYLWRREPRPGRGRGRAARVVAAATAYLGFCGLLVWVAFWLAPPPPAGLVLAGAGYETNLAVPHNVFGKG